MVTLSDYEAFKRKQSSNEAGAAGVVLAQDFGGTPDAAAADMTLAAEHAQLTGAPAAPSSLVKEYRSTFQANADALKASTVLSSSPTLSAWLREPDNAAVARDDLSNLSWFEQQGRGAVNALDRGMKQIEVGFNQGAANSMAQRNSDRSSSFGEILADERTRSVDGLALIFAGWRQTTAMLDSAFGNDTAGKAAAYQQRAAEVSAKIAAIPKTENAAAIDDWMAAMDWTSPDAVSNILQNVALNPIGFVEWISQVGLEVTPQLVAATAATVITRNPTTGAMVFGGSSVVTNTGAQSLEFVQEAGYDLTTPKGAMAAIKDKALMSDAYSRGAAYGLVVGAIDTLSGGLASVSLADSEFASLFLQTLLQGGLAGAGEASGQVAAGMPIDPGSIFAEMLGEFGSAPAEVAGVGGKAFKLRQDKAKSAADRVAMFQELSGQAVSSKLRERMPDKFRQFIERATANGPVENVFIPADKFVEYFQGQGIDPAEMAATLKGVTAADLETAIETGGNLKIPTASYAASIAGSNHDAWLMENMKFNPDDFTSAEANDFNAKIDDVREEAYQLADQLRRDDEELNTVETEIFDTMVSRLRVAGRATDVATTEAMLYPAFYRTMAERSGMTTADFMARYPLPKVQASIPAGMQLKDVTELKRTLVEARNRRKVSTETGVSILEFIDARGGVDDPGGDITAMDAATVKRGKGKKTLRIVRKANPLAGMVSMLGGGKAVSSGALDAAAHAAYEAGYMSADPRVMAYHAAQLSGGESVDIVPALLDAIRGEMSGARDHGGNITSEAPTDGVDTMEEYLSTLGVSLDNTDEEIRAAMERGQGAASDGAMYAQGSINTSSEAFKAWFGDSKVVDAQGKPLVVYHGSRDDIGGAFDPNKTADRVFWFTEDLGSQDLYAGKSGNVTPVYLSIKNPAVMDYAAFDILPQSLWSRLKGEKPQRKALTPAKRRERFAELQAQGYDGIHDKAMDVWVAFEPTQIKSQFNRGTWSKSDPNILFQGAAPDVQAFADELQSSLGLRSVMLSVTSAGALSLDMLAVQRGELGQGKGSKAMSRIIAFADQHGMQITLTAGQRDDGFGTTSNERLRKFYKRFGFVENKGRRKDFSISGTMYRDPVRSSGHLFQAEGSGFGTGAGLGARGSIQFPAAGVGRGDTIISTFAGADLSTVIHESGHYFLTVLKDMAETTPGGAVAAEFDAIKDWWHANADAVARDGMRVVPGVTITADDVRLALDAGTSGDAAKDGVINVGMQEQFARATEAYLMEGKAPSIELRGAFEKFRAWLISIYRKALGLNVAISDEMRGVFDRMLATDQQIADAKADAGDKAPLFATAEEMGMTPDDYAKFVKLHAEATDEAAAAVLASVMAPIRRAATALYKAERRAVVADVTKALQGEPIYRAIQELRFAKDYAGEDVPAVKISRAAIEADYGPGHIPFLPGATKDGKGHRNAVFSDEGGLHPDVVAGMYGFASGDAFLNAIEKAPDLADAIKAEVEKEMATRHSDPLTDGSVQRVALDATHSDKRGKVLAAELHALNEVAGYSRGLTVKEARETARRTLQGMKVRDAVRSDRFLAAERNAGEASFTLGKTVTREGMWMDAARRKVAGKVRAAVKGGDPAAALAVNPATDKANANTLRNNAKVGELIEAKRRQLLNHMLYAESLKVAAGVDALVTKSGKLNKSDARLSKARNVDYVRAARAIAAKFGLARAESDFDFAMWIEQLRSDDAVTADALTSAIETYGQDAKAFKDLTVGELGAIADAIESIMEIGKRARLLEIDGKSVERELAISELRDVLDQRPQQANIALSRSLTKWEQRKVGALSILSGLRRMEAWTRDMDDGKAGAFTRYLVKPVMDAIGVYRMDKADRLAALLDIINPRKGDLLGRSISAPELNNHVFKNKGEFLHALLHTGNESNLEKLLMGRGWSSGLTGQKQRTTAGGKPSIDRQGNPLMTRGRVDTSKWDALVKRMIAEGTLTKADYETAQAIWDLMDEIKRPAQSAHRRVYGFYFKEVEAAPLVTPFGTFRGGYVPAIADADASNDGQIRADQAAHEAQQTSFMFPTTGAGFTKSRVQNYTTPLSLNLMLLPAHMDKVLRFTHLQPVIRQTASLVTSGELRNAIDAVDKTIIPNLITPWLQRTSQQAVETMPTTPMGRSLSNIARGLRKRVGVHTMFMNLVNTAQQITGLSSAMILVKPSRLKSALVRFTRGDGAAMRAEASAASVFMRDRIENAGREITGRIQEAIVQPTAMSGIESFVNKHGYVLQQGAQNLVDVITWHAAYDQAVAGGMSPDDAVFEADSVIRRAMGDFSPENLSLFETGNAFSRLFTMFYSYFNGQANLVGGEMQTAMRTMGWEGSGRMFFIYMFGMAIPAIVGSLIVKGASGGLDDDEEDGYLDELVELFFGSQFQYATAMVPGGTLANTMINRFNNQFYDDKLSTSPVVSALEKSVSAPASVWDAATGQGSAKKAVTDSLAALGLITGIPMGQLSKMAGYGVGVLEGSSTPENLVQVMQGLASGRDGTEN